MISKIIILILIGISGYVAYRLSRKQNPWPFVVLYWVVLTIKNLCDLMGW